ncbi:MAG TPA: hypothetical protein VE713_20015 [Pyrinomonadaceae bacterium]|nr:hypothetical protein [Pyrinomonadaceae bacterium]
MRDEERRDATRATEGPQANSKVSDGPPPVGGSWAALYAFVLAVLAVLVLLFYLFTRAFR